MIKFFIKDYMVYKFKGVEVYYNYIDKGTRPLILLHGWARSSQDFQEFISFYENQSILTIDFPPFGKSSSNLKDWDIYTYVSLVIYLCDHLNIESADILGHSFGGRIAIILSCVKRSLVHSCILVDSAGIKPKRSLKFKLNKAIYKLNRKMGRQGKDRSSPDYKALSPAMKETFKSVVNTNLENYAKHITAPTLIIWGKKDDQTPMYMAKKLKRLIKNSHLEIIENGGHFSFIECGMEFFSIVYQFLRENL